MRAEKQLVDKKRQKELEMEEMTKRQRKAGAKERNRRWKKQYNKKYWKEYKSRRNYDWIND